MDNCYFNLKLEFNKENIHNTIQHAIENGTVGYVCAIDGNNLVSANKNSVHLQAVNGAMLNLCDSSWIPMFVNYIHKTNYTNYTGSDFFLKYINLKQYRQFFLGSTPDILEGLKNRLITIDPAIADMRFETLPFRDVETFDYPEIAQMINDDNPDIIWISLGAPKQEQFMFRLKPFLKKGVMFGFGAVFNFYSGKTECKRAPQWVINFRMEWLFRTFQEPKRMVKRYWHVFVSLPKLIKNEIKAKRNCK